MSTAQWRSFKRTFKSQTLTLPALTDKSVLSPGLGRPFSYTHSDDMKSFSWLISFPILPYCCFRTAPFLNNSCTPSSSLLCY